MFNKEELMAKAKKPAEDAMKLHPFYKGKIQTAGKYRPHLNALSGILTTLLFGTRRVLLRLVKLSRKISIYLMNIQIGQILWL